MSAKRGHWALCRSRVVAFGKILGLRVSVAVSPHAGATKTPLNGEPKPLNGEPKPLNGEPKPLKGEPKPLNGDRDWMKNSIF